MGFTKYIPRVKNVSSLDSLHANSIRGKLWCTTQQQVHSGTVKPTGKWIGTFTNVPPLWIESATTSWNNEPSHQHGKSPWTVSTAFQVIWTTENTSSNIFSHWQASWSRGLASRYGEEINYCKMFRPREGIICSALSHRSSRIVVGEFSAHASQRKWHNLGWFQGRFPWCTYS